jgi:hypothetical protein
MTFDLHSASRAWMTWLDANFSQNRMYAQGCLRLLLLWKLHHNRLAQLTCRTSARKSTASQQDWLKTVDQVSTVDCFPTCKREFCLCRWTSEPVCLWQILRSFVSCPFVLRTPSCDRHQRRLLSLWDSLSRRPKRDRTRNLFLLIRRLGCLADRTHSTRESTQNQK